MQTKYIVFNEADIYYRVVGKGNAVVLLHGFGEDGNIWKNQIKFLSPNFTLIIPDLPGSGLSPLSSHLLKPSIELYAQIIKAIINEEKIEQCTMIGHSMGGYIALAFAEIFPTSLNGLGLFHSTSFVDSEQKIIARKKAIEFIQIHGAYTFLKTSIPDLFYNHSHKAIAMLTENGHLFYKQTLINYYKAMIHRYDKIDFLTSTPLPILFIIGKHDKAVSLQNSLQQCHLPTLSFVHILHNSGHMGMVEESKKSNQYLLNFLTFIKERKSSFSLFKVV